jgi:hypothetical protein
MMEAMPSPITGAEGNVEFLVHCRAGAPSGSACSDGALDDVIAAALAAHGG